MGDETSTSEPESTPEALGQDSAETANTSSLGSTAPVTPKPPAPKKPPVAELQRTSGSEASPRVSFAEPLHSWLLAADGSSNPLIECSLARPGRP